MNDKLTIKQAASRTFKSIRTIELWEKKGLIQIRRDKTGHRYFTKQDLDKIKEISQPFAVRA